ncbi:hypothetical protein OIV83_001275 [Microbotryomycetes sp. JL201]|nr:hypothetical protein OIV83_001275 [Microbotryomycetes sp. JL201]
MHADQLPSPSAAPAADRPPPRKKSKWDDASDDDHEQQKQQKRQQKLAARLEREKRLGKVAGASDRGAIDSAASSRATSREHSLSAADAERTTRTSGRAPTRRALRGRSAHPPLQSCRSVYNYERLNEIEEGSYGIVFRARCKTTGDIVALKKIKMDKEKNGFPITSLREIQTLMVCNHENIVRVREIVVGDTLTQVFIVMDFVEHDLKTLLSTMPTPFLASEIKTLMMQLLSAMALCHDNWIVHRDLKTSNLLMNNRGQIKVADFGLARTYGDPLGDMTQLVVTLWYRAPELLFGATEYSTAVDMWSIGCIFGELILKEPLLPGKGEIDQVSKARPIFKLLGRPTEEMWPGFTKLPNVKSFNLTSAQPQTFRYLTQHGLDLLQGLLTYDPDKRLTAEQALKHPYFQESPLPKHPDLFASFPSVANGEKKHVFASPSAPARDDL